MLKDYKERNIMIMMMEYMELNPIKFNKQEFN